ncbi:unnamed protein product [Mortierella alpina]
MLPYPSPSSSLSSASRGKQLAPIDTSTALPSCTPLSSNPVDCPARDAKILAREILQARLYGILPSLYASSIWCCDHYRLDLSLSLILILAGAYVLWHCYPSSRSRRVSAAVAGVAAAAAPDKESQFNTIMPSAPTSVLTTSPAAAVAAVAPNTAATRTIAAALSSTTEHLSIPSSSVQQQQQQQQASVVSVSGHAGTCDETGQSAEGRRDNPNVKMELETSFPRGLNSPLVSADSPLPAYPPPPYRSKCNSPCLQENSGSAAHWPHRPSEPQERPLARIRLWVHGLGAAGVLVGFGLWTVWSELEALPQGQEGLMWAVIGAVLVCAAIVYRTLKGGWSSRAAEAISGAGSILDALQGAQEEPLRSGEVVSRRVLAEKKGFVDTHYEKSRDALVESTSELLKEHRLQQVCSVRRSSSSPTLASPTTFSMVHEVKSEFRLWALSFFMLAPPVPRSIEVRGERRSTVKSAPRGLGIMHLDEHEYDMVQKREVYDLKVDVAHGEGGVKRSQGQDEFIRRRTRPSKDHAHKRGHSESVAGAITRAPPSQSTLSKLARIHLDPERFGGIFQYYRRRQAAANSRDCGGNGHLEQEEEQEQDTGIAFVVRSSTLPIVRVGLYGATQKRLWSSTGTMNEIPPETCADLQTL